MQDVSLRADQIINPRLLMSAMLRSPQVQVAYVIGHAQAAYARQWEEQVRKKQAELASRAGADSAAHQAGSPGRPKTQGGWIAEPKDSGLVKPEPKQEVLPSKRCH